MEIKDQLNNVLCISKTPKRIVCLVPSITELLVDLGLESSIVGVTKFCIHPKNLRKKKTIIGGTKNVHFDKISVLNPDIIICNKEENTKEIVENCNKITTTYVSDISTIADTLEMIFHFGKLFSCEEKASEIITEIKLKEINFSNSLRNSKSKKVAYFIWKNPWMVAANKTFINHLLELNNFENVYKHKNRYPKIQLSAIKEIENLDCIFLSSEPYPFKEKHIIELKNNLPNVKIILVDGEYFSWYGSRLISAFEYFKKLQETF